MSLIAAHPTPGLSPRGRTPNTTTRAAARALVTLALALAAGCAADPGNSTVDISAGVFDAGLDTSVLDANALDAAAIDSGAALDTGVADSGASEDAGIAGDVTTAADATQVCPGAPGCDCKNNDDCDNGLCNEDPTVDSVYGKVCASKCVDTCKAGYSCVQATGAGGDAVSLCVPTWGRVCNPCGESKECESLGVPGMACVTYGSDGGFCGSPCAKDGDCDSGYHCAETESAEGAKAKWCVRSPAIKGAVGLGKCPCSPSATKAKLSTTCLVEHKDDQGAVTAKCAGSRSCLSAGLSVCVAPDVSSEVCDGKDNDCDGETDEDTCDDQNACTTDSCDVQAGKCVFSTVQDGLACDADGSVCTDKDSCAAGVCKAGPLLNCDDKNPCTKDACDPAKGCAQTPADGSPCDDDNPCTIGDLCKGNSCDAGQPKKCDSGDACVLASCSLSDNGKCVFKNAIAGLPCDDGNACSEQDGCKDGSCTAGKVANCDDGNPCTSDSCDNKAGCAHANNTKPCGLDGDPCTIGALCKAGKCQGGTQKVCDDKNPCTTDSCSKATGACVFDGKSTLGKTCTDGNLCTESDGCKDGKCAGVAKSCDDGNPCSTGTCQSDKGCVQVNKSGLCDDGNSCTKSDTCKSGKCTGVGKSCDDGNPCTKDSCDVKQDCTHSATTGPCTDGDACTEKDACANGKCAGNALSCDDGNVCTTDSCNKLGGCQFTANTVNCTDSDKCTSNEVCSNKVCKKSATVCDDKNPCTTDSCSATLGCQAANVGDQTSCKADNSLWCIAGKCVTKTAANKSPVAKLVCPGAANVGAAATLDGSGSTDPDGTLVKYAFDFGDGSAVSTGGANKVQHSFKKAGTFKATLVVTDNGGLSASASCSIAVSAAAPPVVSFIKPTGSFNATQGESVGIILDATAPAGKSVAKVELLVNGQVALTDTALPYTMTWVVPKTAKTGSVMTLQARATDSGGGVGVSAVLKVAIKNDKPVAAFTATVVGKLTVAVDGSLAKDTETPTSKLVVRFDWTNDGTFDTPWSTTKTYSKVFAKEGTYVIKMEVRDEDGQVTSATRTVSLSLVSQVGGTINTTTWTGTIIVTGDIIVPKGQILTVSAGTSILFVPVDQDNNKIGDFDIWVYGKLKLLGTAAAPVTVSTYGPTKTKGRDWGRIQLKGEGSALQHAVIENGQIGVEVLDTSTLADVTLRNNVYGMQVSAGGNATVTNLTSSNNVTDGVQLLSSGKLTATGVTLASNGRDGLHQATTSTGAKLYLKDAVVASNVGNGIWARSTASNMSFSLLDSQVKSNGLTGVTLVGGMTGAVTRNQLLYNNQEGLRIAPYLTTDVQVVGSYNNIFGNALKSAWNYSALNLSAKRSGSGSGAATSAAWGTPKGELIAMVRVAYSEYDYANKYVSGTVRKDSSGGATMFSTSSPLSTSWADVASSQAKKLVVQAYKSTSSSSYYGTMSASGVVYEQPGLKRELTVITHTKSVDLRHNYLGVFPDVLSVVTRSSSTSANLHGFMGKPYDATWAKGPYWGGSTLSANTSWSGEVWVTGDLVVAAGKSLTVAAGTTVHMVRYDAANDGRGDFKIDVLGALLVNGTSGAGVSFSTYGSKKTRGKDWQRITLKGSGSKVQYASFEYGAYGLEVYDTTPIDHVTVNMNEYGLVIRSPGGAVVTNLTATESALDGVHVSTGGKVTLDKLLTTKNLRHGVYIVSSSTATNVSIKASTLNSNKGDGLRAESSTSGMKVAMVDSHAKSNSWAGVYLRGGMTGTLSRNQWLYNGYEGLRAAAYQTWDVQATATYNNIFGNGLTGAWMYKSLSLSAKRSGSGSGAATSAAWATPNSSVIDHVRVAYSEYDYANKYVSGSVRKDSSGGAAIVSTSGPLASSWFDVSGSNAKQVVAQAYKSTSSSSYYGTMSLTAAVWTQMGVKREVSVIAHTKTMDTRHNFLGSFPDVLKVVTLSSSTAANLHGFMGVAFDNTWKKGPYKGGESLAANATWSGEVWVTGDYIVPAGKLLTIAAGTKVHMVKYDVASDGTGDIDMTVQGGLTVDGTAQSPVAFSELGGNKAKGSWNQILATGTSSAAKISHAVFSYGVTGLHLGTGKHTLTDVSVRSSKSHGVLVSGATSVIAKTLVTQDSGGSGLYVTSSSGVSVDKLSTTGNAAHGVFAGASKSSVTIKNATATGNAVAGFHSDNASVTFSQCTLSGNQIGAWFHSSSAGLLSKCDVKYNLAEGVILSAQDLKQPSPKINDNNIYGNGTKEGLEMSAASLTAKRSGSGSGAATSAVWTSPYFDATKKTLAPIWAVRAAYSEYDYANKYVSGSVRKDSSGGAAIWSTSSPYSAQWRLLYASKATKIVAQAYKSTSSSSYWGTQSIYSAFYRLAGKQVELAAITDSGTVDCTNNYWGGFSGFDKRFVLSRTNAINFQGFAVLAKNVGPQ